MKAAFILALAGLAASQNLSGEPACATSCLSSAISKAGCKLDDQACQCGPTQSAIGSLAAPCLIGACAASDLIIAATVGSKLCAVYSSGLASATGSSSGSSSSMVITTTTTSSSSESTSTSTETSSVTTTSSSSTSSSGSSSGTGVAASTTTTGSSTVSGNLAAAATPVVVGVLAAMMGVVAAM
ncbi:hypothetical protein CONLIGDRAFT_631154 [Coniochaeta ligniaria NRRL 30616]|uniref:CFEM domain-containing protein n=1 Tax=Coniochaeta ligniaria NRRL 30616 TaxID=1408157 RepID=A0A1J7IU79_9PEZI|nr:hypothetical protein CONLIGDRAFT_631154 [Coniochaeta ligniaria NRRL 30616]